eukprot:10055-Chlamydomonas_euryale.AAC.2
MEGVEGLHGRTNHSNLIAWSNCKGQVLQRSARRAACCQCVESTRHTSVARPTPPPPPVQSLESTRHTSVAGPTPPPPQVQSLESTCHAGRDPLPPRARRMQGLMHGHRFRRLAHDWYWYLGGRW